MSVTIPSWLSTALAGGGLDLVETWADLYQAGVKVAEVDVVDGTVKAVWGQDITSTVDLTLAGWDGFLPETPVVGTDRRFGDDLFGDGIYGEYRHAEYRTLAMPVKTKAVVYWKATVGTNTHTVTLGSFTVVSVEWADEPDGPRMKLAGSDVSWDLAQSKWLTPHQVPEGTTLTAAITGIVDDYLPGTGVTMPTVGYTTPLATYLPGTGGDIWRACADLASAAGLELVADRAGDLTGVVSEDDEGASPVWSITDTGTGIRFTETPDADQLCNTVLAFGEGAGATPVYAVAQDTAGPFGTTAVGRAVVREYRSPLIRTTGDAMNAAVKLLHRWSAVSEVVEVDTAPVPHLDPGDYVRIVSDGLELDDTFRVVTVTAPLTVGRPWKVTARRRLT